MIICYVISLGSFLYCQRTMFRFLLQVTCQSIQAHLVEIYTMEELEFVQNFSLDNGESMSLPAHFSF